MDKPHKDIKQSPPTAAQLRQKVAEVRNLIKQTLKS